MRHTDLLVQVSLSQGQLHGLPDLLLLHIQTTHVRIRDIGLLMCAEHSN